MRSLTSVLRTSVFLAAALASAIFLSTQFAAAQEAAKEADTSGAQSSPEARAQYSDAVKFQNAGKFDLAADEYAAFLKNYADDPLAGKARHYLGVCQVQQKKYAEGAEALTKVLNDNPRFELADATWFYLGFARFKLAEAAAGKQKTDELSRAVTALTNVGKSFPKSPLAAQSYYYLGEAHYAAGNRGEAVAAYRALVDGFPNDALVPDALYALGYAYEELKQYEKANQAYDGFLAKHSRHELAADVTMRKGEALLASGDAANAEKWFAKAAAIEGFREADHALFQQGSAAFEQQQYERAAALFSSVADRFPKSPELRLASLNAGNALYRLKKYEQARGALSKVWDGNDEAAAESLHLAVRSHIDERKPAEAIALLSRRDAKGLPAKWAAVLRMDEADAMFEIPEQRKEAVAKYAALAKDFPQHPKAADALYMAGFASLQSGDYQAALDYAATFAKTFGDHALAPDVQYTAAEAHLLSQQFDTAEKMLGELMAKYPSHKEAGVWRRRIGYAMFLQDRFDDAVKQLSPLVAQTSEPAALADLQYWLGASYAKLKQPQQALAALQASLDAAPKGRMAQKATLALAQVQAESGNLEAAVQTARRAVDHFPRGDAAAEAYYRLGVLLSQAGNAKESGELFARVIEQWPDSSFAPFALHNLALAQIGQKQYAEAEKALTTVLEKHAKHPLALDALLDRGHARQLAGKYDAAADDIAKFLDADPPREKRSPALHVLGICQDRLKKPQEAVKTYETLLKDDPKYAEAAGVLYELGWSLKGLKRDADATAAFARLADEHPKSPYAAEASYLVGEQRYAEKAYDKALAAYEQAAAAKPEGAVAEKIVHKLGWAHYRLKAYKAAHAVFARQIDAWPSGPLAADALFMLGESLFQQNKHAEALAAYERAEKAKLSTDDIRVLTLLHAGQSAAQLKQWAKSLEYLQKVVSNHANSYWVADALYEQGWATKNLADDADGKGQADQAAKLYDQAIAHFDAAARKAAGRTDQEVGARARFMQGEVHFQKKEHKEAIRNFFKVAQGYGYPNSPPAIQRWQAKACYEMGRVYEVMKLVDEARSSYREVVEKFPTSEVAAAARKRVEELSGGASGQ
jgi:TolA-binding protein